MPIQKSVLFGTLALLSLCRPAWSDETTARVNLDNLAAYTNPVVAWSDQHSNVALAWPRQDEPGLQNLTSVVGWGGAQITDRLLNWNLSEDRKPLPLKLKSRNFRPDKVVEIDAADGLELTVIAAWPAQLARPRIYAQQPNRQAAHDRTKLRLSRQRSQARLEGPLPRRPVCLAGERTRGMLVEHCTPTTSTAAISCG